MLGGSTLSRQLIRGYERSSLDRILAEKATVEAIVAAAARAPRGHPAARR